MTSHSTTWPRKPSRLKAQVEGLAARERLEPGADVADVGAGLVGAPQD